MNSLLRKPRERSFSRPVLTKYVILLGVGLWMLTLSAVIASLNQEPDADWQASQESSSIVESAAADAQPRD
jgi:hypothetical protein